MNYSVDTLSRLISRHSQGQQHRADIPGLRLHEATKPNPQINTIYRPSLCLVAQGHKQVLLNDRMFEYDSRQYLIVTVDLPVTGCIVHASPQRPYLGLSLDLDPGSIADVLFELPANKADSQPVSVVVKLVVAFLKLLKPPA